MKLQDGTWEAALFTLLSVSAAMSHFRARLLGVTVTDENAVALRLNVEDVPDVQELRHAIECSHPWFSSVRDESTSEPTWYYEPREDCCMLCEFAHTLLEARRAGLSPPSSAQVRIFIRASRVLAELSRPEDFVEELSALEATGQDSTGNQLVPGSRVIFRGEQYTVRGFGRTDPSSGSRVVVFEEDDVHTNEIPTETSVDRVH